MDINESTSLHDLLDILLHGTGPDNYRSIIQICDKLNLDTRFIDKLSLSSDHSNIELDNIEHLTNIDNKNISNMKTSSAYDTEDIIIDHKDNIISICGLKIHFNERNITNIQKNINFIKTKTSLINLRNVTQAILSSMPIIIQGILLVLFTI